MKTSNLASERYFTEPEEKQLFKTVNKYSDVYARRDAAWMLLLRHTGIRIGTMSLLTVGDAQTALKNNRLVLRPEICKRKKGYSVFLNKKSSRALRVLLSIRKELGYTQLPESPLVMSRNHLWLSVRSYQSRLRFWCETASLDIKATPHYFRHTAAHRAMERSTAVNPLLVVQSMLGHSCINNTAIYNQPNREQMASDMQAIS